MKAKIIVLFLMLVSIAVQSQITGLAFRDYNADGIQQGGEPGRGNILVKFFSNAPLPSKDALLGSTTTAGDGSYSFNPPSYPVRIEFEIPNGFCNLGPNQDFSAPNGNTYGTAVQFATGPSVKNFIISYPADYSITADPQVFTTCFVNGDPLIPGSSADAESFVGMNYLDTGDGSNSGVPGAAGPPHDIVGLNSQVGPVWGVGVSRQARQVFTAAILKRHAGLGPLGGGGIYKIPVDAPLPGNNWNTTANYSWLDFDTDLNIPTSNEAGAYTNALTGPGSNEVNFSPVIGSNGDRGLTSDRFAPSQDAAAWEQVGRVSFGDLDVSEDGRWLYVINLYDKKLYQIDLVDPFNPVKPVLADVGTKVKGFDTPAPCSGNAGQHIPWGIKITRGKVFVAMICNGADAAGNTIGTVDDIRGYVYEFDMATQAFNSVPIIDFPLNYRNSTANRWVPWTNNWIGYFEGEGFPIITDIEFDGKGNMILGMVDRRCHQAGWANHDLNGDGFYSIANVGDILQAVRDPNVPACTYSFQFDPEFYKDDLHHPEPVNGGLSVHRTSDSDNILATYMDPVQIWSGGTVRFDNYTGNRSAGYTIYYQPGGNVTGSFGKAAGIGDIEVVPDLPIIEIGNYVWLDLDKDGIQDGNEPPIVGVIVELLDAGGNVIGTSVTDGNGGYYFNASNVTDPAGNGYPGPLPYTNYMIRISPTQFNSQGVNATPLQNHVMTASNQSGTGLSDYSDNDASIVGGIAKINITTGAPGENNHTYDFGFISCTLSVTCSSNPQTSCTPSDGSATVQVSGGQGNISYIWSSGEVTNTINGKSAGTYTVTVTDDYLPGCTAVCQAIIGTSITLPTATCSQIDNSNCVTPNGSASVTTNANQILWSTGSTNLTINGLAAGTYTVTVTNSTTGCANTCQSVIGNAISSPTCTIIANTQPSCANLTGGSITVNPSPAGTYTYTWSDNGAATANRTGLTGGTYTVTVTNASTGCTGVCNITLTTPTNCCNINAIVPQNLECVDNGTPSIVTDNRIRFNAMVTNTNTSLTGYNVTINGGTTITPNTNVPYGVTQFTLGAGTAGGGATYTITVTDSATPGCTRTFQVVDPGTCEPATPECPPVQCGTASIQVNGN